MANATNGKTPTLEGKWETLPDDDLLQVRICDLKLRIEGTDLENRIQTFYHELDQRKITFKPLCYLGDEWFCPDGSASIAIPFYLAHPRLMKLEQRMMMEVEGGTEAWAMRLLRHEMGHVIIHAYHLEKKREWQKLFGSPSDDYSEFYRARPYSKRFVRHLDDWYAQSHPEEDFSETFAIWLTPGLDWRRQYKGWKALEKLEYVNHVMKELEGVKPLDLSREKWSEASRLRSRLKTYYQRKRRLYDQDLPDFFDTDLRQLFTDPSKFPSGERAATFLRRAQRPLLEAVSRWTGEPKLTITRLMKDLIQRCKELDLRVVKDAEQTRTEITAYLTTMATHYRLTGRFKTRKKG